MKQNNADSLRIVLAYFAGGVCWIFFSDRLLAAIVSDPVRLTFWATLKGWVFVALSTVLLFVVLRRSMGRIQSSEQKWKLLFDAAPDAYYLQDPNGTFLDGNRAAEELCGYAKQELIGRNVLTLDLLIPNDRAQAARLLAENARGSSTGPDHYTIKRKDGRLVSAEIRTYPVQIEQKPVLLSIARDVTERKKAEERLRRSEARFSAIFQASPMAIAISELKEGRYVDANDKFLQTIGFERTEVIGHTALKLGIWPNPEARAAVVEVLRREGRLQEYAMQFRRRDGTVADLLLFAELLEIGTEQYLVAMVLDVTKRKKAEESLARHQAELAAIYDSAPMMICVVNSQRQIERMNRTMAEFLGADSAPAGPQRPGDLFGCVNAREKEGGCGHGQGCERCPLPLAIFTTFQTGKPCHEIETRLVLTKNGATREIRIRASTALVKFQHEPKVLLFFEDVTAQKALEAQLMQAQKMEAVGQLAGGVAHDFNNILAAMLLHLQFLQLTGGLSTEVLASLRELELGTHRAAGLTRQLLLFGRRQAMELKRVDLGQIVEGLTNMLRRLIGEHIEMTFQPAYEKLWVEADPGMLEQILMNLCVNARDAMPDGGKLRVKAEETRLDTEHSRLHPDSGNGRFACLSVSDTGCGMDPATLKRIFEPFFTTKPAGKGTGLGLATAYGIAKEHRGWIEAESVVDQGSTFRVFLPLCNPPPRVEETLQNSPCGGSESILLVEDDENVRRMVKLTLGHLGYQIREAASGLEAIELNFQEIKDCKVLFTDMVMPGGFTGLEVAEHFRNLNPNIKVIISSGYSDDLLQQVGKLPAGIRFLSKPYSPAALARMVREALDE